jgi:hypothetical protein
VNREVSPRWHHLKKIAEARAQGKALPWDDPVWQEEIRAAKQRVADHEAALKQHR